jgi:hypothetical protein
MPTTVYEFRIPEDEAAIYLPPGLGATLGGSIRRVQVEGGAPLFETMRRSYERARKNGSVFLAPVALRRQYSREELAQAEAFQLLRWTVFEQAGEEYGKLYDYSTSCSICRVGRLQQKDLVLNLFRVPRKDIAFSIGGEIVVSERFVQLARSTRLTGFELRPVHHDGQKTRRPEPRWQVVPDGPAVELVTPPTRFGMHAFDEDADGLYRCPNGHVAGLNILSELSVTRASWPALDLTATRQHVGDPWPADPTLPPSEWVYGVLIPVPLLVISRRFLRMLERNNLTGWRVEVAYFAG